MATKREERYYKGIQRGIFALREQVDACIGDIKVKHERVQNEQQYIAQLESVLNATSDEHMKGMIRDDIERHGQIIAGESNAIGAIEKLANDTKEQLVICQQHICLHDHIEDGICPTCGVSVSMPADMSDVPSAWAPFGANVPATAHIEKFESYAASVQPNQLADSFKQCNAQINAINSNISACDQVVRAHPNPSDAFKRELTTLADHLHAQLQEAHAALYQIEARAAENARRLLAVRAVCPHMKVHEDHSYDGQRHCVICGYVIL